MKIIEVKNLKEIPVGCYLFDPSISAEEAIAKLKRRDIVPEVIYKLMEQIRIPK